MKSMLLLVGIFSISNVYAELCANQYLQPNGQSLDLYGVSIEKRANAISQTLANGCANSTDLVGHKTYSAEWDGSSHDRIITTCSSDSGGQVQIAVSFPSYPYSHARMSRDGGCEKIIPNDTEVELLRKQGQLR